MTKSALFAVLIENLNLPVSPSLERNQPRLPTAPPILAKPTIPPNLFVPVAAQLIGLTSASTVNAFAGRPN